jgi:hypothetical protein
MKTEDVANKEIRLVPKTLLKLFSVSENRKNPVSIPYINTIIRKATYENNSPTIP